jgi:molybdate transport system ATP-binding protein
VPEPHLTIDVAIALPMLRFEVAFALTAPWTCLFGPSGSGKTTILRALAGFERPTRGRIVLGNQALFDDSLRINLPPHRRPVRLAAQQTWLFPGSVAGNVAYGMSPLSKTAHLESVLELTQLAAMAKSDVRSLSGGEHQRVAIARAFAAAAYGDAAPCLLLLDEPFTGMDAALRDQVALALRDAASTLKIPVLSVTHDLGEVFLLGAEVMRLEPGGTIVQGPAEQVLAPERDRLFKLIDHRL